MHTFYWFFSLAATCAAGGDVATFQLTRQPRLPGGPPISPRFVGFSIEVGSTPGTFNAGGLAGTPRRSFAALANALRAASGDVQGPNVRVGGNSADESAYVPNGGPLPANITYRITDADLRVYAAAAALWNGTITLDTQMRHPDLPVLDTAHVGAALSILGAALEKVEIGNEPDLFFKNGIRPSSYGYSDYKPEYAQLSAALQPLLPRKMLQGATWASGRWDNDFADYMSAFEGAMSSVSIHRYPETVCGNATATVARLLDDSAAEGQAAAVASWVTRAQGVPLFIGEGNSVSCGGAAGVSDVWASSLWALDILFGMASVGVQRWNFHGMPGGPYAVFNFPNPSTEEVEVRPIFYGLLAFSAAAGGASVITNVTTVASTNPFIKCWCVVDSGNRARVVLIHKDMNATANATVTVVPAAPAASGDATLARGLPDAEKGVHSKWNDGISWGGQTWATTSNGAPAGAATTESVPLAGGAYQLQLPPGSFAMLSLPSASVGEVLLPRWAPDS